MNTNTLDVATSIDELKSHIDPPLHPQQVQWQVIAHHKDETRLPGGRYSLVALLDYTPSQIEQLKQISGIAVPKHGLFVHRNTVQLWWPQSIQDALITVDDETSKFEVQGYNAEPFLLAGAGWKPGYWIHVEETSQILLLLGMTN